MKYIIAVIIMIAYIYYKNQSLNRKIRNVNSLERENYGKAYYEYWANWSQRQIDIFNKPSSPIFDSIFKGKIKNAK